MLPRLRRQVMAADAELVHLPPGDAVLARHQLSRDALRYEVVQLHQLRWGWRAGRHRVGTHGHARHRFDTACDRDIADARLDEIRCEMDRLLAGPALPVNGCRRSG